MECDDIDDLAYAGRLTVDLKALAENYLFLKKRVEPADIAAVVKANGYGLGVKEVSAALYKAGCRYFFVAQLSEAQELRPHLDDDATIAILNGVLPGSERMVAMQGFVPVLNTKDAVQAWSDLSSRDGQAYPAIIQVDTGMSRLGLDRDEVAWLQSHTEVFRRSTIDFIMSHLASGDEPMSAQNARQLQTLKDIVRGLPRTKIAFANSGGIFLGHDYHYDLTRPGIALYGVDPFNRSQSGLRPVVKLEGRVIQLRTVPAGTHVGYGGTFTTQRTTKIATIGIGYADGWHRALGNKGSAFVKGKRVPIIGRISMDSMTLDVTDVEEKIDRGEFVELVGAQQSLIDVANDAGTIAYEILTSLGHRYQRIYC